LVTNGQEAIHQVNLNPPDLILLDLWMPDMNGLEVAGVIRNYPGCQHIPIIFITEDYTQPDELLIDQKTYGLIRQPVSIEQLILNF